jgi:HK97 family phage portal protein
MKGFMNRWGKRGAQEQPALSKASTTSPMVAYHTVGKPVWTPRRYESLSQEGYRKNVIVYRAVNLISRGVASVPWRLYNHEKELSLHPLLTLLHAPGPLQGGASFMEMLASYLLLAGNSYVEAVMLPSGQVGELHALRPDRMKVIPGKSGLPQAYEYSVNGQSKILHQEGGGALAPVLHLKLFNPLNDWYGMSPLEAASCSIDQHNTVAAHNLALLQNGGRPSGALIVGGENK